MRTLQSMALVAGLLSEATADGVIPRALPNAPNGYAPANVSCPAERPTIRSASSLSSNETSWLSLRRNHTAQAMRDFFGHVSLPGFDAVSYIDRVVNDNATNLPIVAIAVSGGGYRAMLTGGGALKAFDSRTPNSTSSGQIGGLLQSATYVSGLSGGSWLLASIYVNNFTTIGDLQADGVGEAWQLGNSILEGPSRGGFQLLSSAEYYNTISDQVQAKSDAGYNTTLTDIWARMLSFQFINATDGGPSYTWSSIALESNFASGSIPMPLVVADLRSPSETIVGTNSTVMEFSPFEFGSWDPTIYGFSPLEYLGSKFNNGSLPQDHSCVRGYDNAGFVFGTSSTLFNDFILYVNSSGLPNVLEHLITNALNQLGRDNEDIADYVNPFYNYTQNTGLVAQTETLSVVDGGEDYQNIPLYPLIQPTRHVDVIFAVDSSADTNDSWPNGASLVYTYERSLNSSGIGNGTSFPAVPDQDTFINKGLNTHPTFFGCNSSNTSTPTPLIVYIPNYPYVAYSNLSTLTLSINNTERDALIQNAYDMATMANGTRDPDWPACVGCAMLGRSFERTNTTVPDICNTCFDRYCWDGTTNSTTPATYAPSSYLATLNVMGGVGSMKVPKMVFLALGTVAMTAMAL
ncbi:Lysophospholipase 1 [Talaromyces marneffei ATCC 18224]|uniref:Lysophospholipase n=1 Tax=Talaromyces marneffei (strain ATCC 18224 / CBS 334.59 / QM 7333) TaxID=441960 RepID=B6QLC0_TALMQ|nr:lysophospholipase Plb1 [Talaromyces marneffei ATCC 18224]